MQPATQETSPANTVIKSPEKGALLFGWAAFVLAVAESLCVAAVGLSGVRVAIGLGSLLSATVGGPAKGFHGNHFRVPALILATVGALLPLLLIWNEERLRHNPAAAWRMRPLTPKQRRSRRIQLVLSCVTLLLVAMEVVFHPWFHHEVSFW